MTDTEAKTCIVLVDDKVDPATWDLLRGMRTLCPEADVAWYNSGPSRGHTLGNVRRVEPSRPLKYAKVAPAFLDILEWAAERDYDHIVNVESDMAFIRPGFIPFVERLMHDADYMAHGFRRCIPAVSQWPAYRSLRAEIPELFSILEMDHLNRGFSPAQVFSRRYVQTVVNSDIYPALRAFVERNQLPGRSHTLQEILMPTLVDRFKLRGRPYPHQLSLFNRYRPYQNDRDLQHALTNDDVHFLHPVRRSADDPVRAFTRDIVEHHEKGSPMPQIVGGSAKNLPTSVLRGADLFEAELSSTSLREVNLSGAYLVSADLRYSDVSMAYLDGAFLKSALLLDADLSGTSLRGAVLREADLTRAHLNGANLMGAYLGEANLRDTDLRHASLAGADLREADLSGADLTGADLRGTLLNAMTWTSQTTWPGPFRATIQAASEQTANDGQFVVTDDPAAGFDLRLDTVPPRTRNVVGSPAR